MAVFRVQSFAAKHCNEGMALPQAVILSCAAPLAAAARALEEATPLRFHMLVSDEPGSQDVPHAVGRLAFESGSCTDIEADSPAVILKQKKV